MFDNIREERCYVYELVYTVYVETGEDYGYFDETELFIVPCSRFPDEPLEAAKVALHDALQFMKENADKSTLLCKRMITDFVSFKYLKKDSYPIER